MREKDEKFGMYLTSLSRSLEALEVARGRLSNGDTGESAVTDLVEGTADILGPYLGEKVSLAYRSKPIKSRLT
jgi:cysteinyl-tRNA synthetase